MDEIKRNSNEVDPTTTNGSQKPSPKVVHIDTLRAMRDPVSSSSRSGVKHRDSIEDVYLPTVPPRRDKILLERELKKSRDETNRRRLDEAFYRLTEACDSNLDMVERSNCFDEWKDILDLLARKAAYMGIKHHKILGSLIAATHQKDLSDFEFNSLKVLREAMNVLRQPRITKQDSKRVITSLLECGMKTALPLAVDYLGEDREGALDNMMAEIVEKSRDQT